MLGDKLFDRHRLAASDLLDHVVRSGKDSVVMIDRDLVQVLGEMWNALASPQATPRNRNDCNQV